MTHDPIIVSVPHSGTRFLMRRLNVEAHIHANANWTQLWERVEGRQIVVPLRKPSDVWRSWCRRHPEDVLKWAGSFFVSWAVLHTLDQMCELDVICVDKCDDPRIDDWKPIGDKDGSAAGWKLHKADLRSLHKLPIVERYFGSWQ